MPDASPGASLVRGVPEDPNQPEIVAPPRTFARRIVGVRSVAIDLLPFTSANAARGV